MGAAKSSLPGLGAFLSSSAGADSHRACAELVLLASLVETVELQQVQPQQTPKSSAQQRLREVTSPHAVQVIQVTPG